MCCSTANLLPPFVICLLFALVSLNLPSKFSAQYAHYPSPLPKKHKPAETPVAEPIVSYFPYVYTPIPSLSEKPYEPQPLSPLAHPPVPYFPFVYIPIPSPSQKPYVDASPLPSPVFSRTVVPYYPFQFPPSPSRKLLYPPNPIDHLQVPLPLPLPRY